MSIMSESKEYTQKMIHDQRNLQAAFYMLLANKVPHDNNDEMEKLLKQATEILNVKYDNINLLAPELQINEDNSTTWKYVILCFYLLFSVKQEDKISMKYIPSVKNAFDFLMEVGITENLRPGIGPPNQLQKGNIKSTKCIKIMYSRLSKSVDGFLKCLSVELLKILLLKSYMSIIIAALIQLSYCPLKNAASSELQELIVQAKHDQNRYKKKFEELLCVVPKASCVQALMACRANTNVPTWCHAVIMQKLKEIIFVEGGVRALTEVLQGLETHDTGLHWRRCELLVLLLLDMITDDQHIIEQQLLHLSEESDKDGRPLKIFQIMLALYVRNTYVKMGKLFWETPFVNTLFFNRFLKYTEQSHEENYDGDNFEYIFENTIPLMHKCFVEKLGHEEPLPVSLLTKISNVLFRLYSAWERKSDLDELESLLIRFMEDCPEETLISLFRTLLFNLSDMSIPRLKINLKQKLHDNINMKNFTSSDGMFYFNTLLNLIKSQSRLDIGKKLFQVLIKTCACICSVEAIEERGLDLSFIKMLVMFVQHKTFTPVAKECFEPMLLFTENLLRMMQLNNEAIQNSLGGSNRTSFVNTLLMLLETMKISDENLLKKLNEVQLLGKSVCDGICVEDVEEFVTSILEAKEPEGEVKKLTKFESALQEMLNPLLPLRVNALVTLRNLVTEGDPETLENKKEIFYLFMECLKCDESYIFLNTIKSIAVLVKRFPEEFLPKLCTEYCTMNNMSCAPEDRLKIGEVISMVISISQDEDVSKYKTLLLNTCLNTARDDDHFMRTSGLVLLGEVSKVLGPQLKNSILYVVDCFHHGLHDNAIEVRRAAISVIRQLFAGLKNETLVLLRHQLPEIVMSLKTLYENDGDSTIRLQAQLAIEELLSNMQMKNLQCTKSIPLTDN